MPDSILPTLDGFSNVFEILLPTNVVFNADNNRPGVSARPQSTNKAIGQVFKCLEQLTIQQYAVAEQTDCIFCRLLKRLSYNSERDP